MSKIDNIINDIQDYIDSCDYMVFSQTKIIVNKDELEQFINELKQATPEEIRSAQLMLAQKKEIIRAAQQSAEDLLKGASERTNQLINESQIKIQAESRANEVISTAIRQAQDIIDNATLEANALKASAMQYMDEMLANIEQILNRASANANDNYNELIANLNSCSAIVKNNRSELHPAEDDFESLGLDETGNSETDILV
ncbi:MAG: vacuolar family H+-ATPase subunit H [Lachnospiraceae bacterium]|nr:vacuolar family H+-ATPase subunit H [Lachnospiraceae bacterium]